MATTISQFRIDTMRDVFSNPSLASELIRLSARRAEWIETSRKWRALIDSRLFEMVHDAVEKNTSSGSAEDQRKNAQFAEALIFEIMLLLENKVEQVKQQWETTIAEQLQQQIQREFADAEKALQENSDEQALQSEEESSQPQTTEEDSFEPKISRPTVKAKVIDSMAMVLIMKDDSAQSFYAEDKGEKNREEFKDPQYYEVLGVQPDASPRKIRKAYRQQALMHHPDKASDDPNAAEKFKEIQQAYAVLNDSAERARYDQFRASSSQRRHVAASAA